MTSKRKSKKLQNRRIRQVIKKTTEPVKMTGHKMVRIRWGGGLRRADIDGYESRKAA